MGGLMTTIITRNSSIPVKQSEVFSTGADFQDSVEIHVLQGERPFAKDNKSLGIFKLKGIPSAPRGVPRINVTFQLDVNGLLAVSAREEQTGTEQSIRIEGASTLSRDDVSKMIKEAEENALADKGKKAITNITYELDNLLSKIDIILEKNFVENSDIQNYFYEILNEIQELYNSNQLTKISISALDNLKYAANILLINYLKKELLEENKKSETNSKKGVVIDVTDD
jgi:molecular chaperone DnaK (HSP70)